MDVSVLKIKSVFVIAVVFIALPLCQRVIGYSAKAVCLYDMNTKEVIYGYNEEVPMEPASITKIVTAITALSLGDTDEIVTVDRKSASTEGSSLYLKAGERIKLSDLLYGLMLHSGNDAANAIATHFGYEDFIDEMNETARLAGAESSHFENPSGLPHEHHYVTAEDMAKITAYALENPVFREISSTKNAQISNNGNGNRYLKNHNKLLWMYDKSIGVKTGFTKSAGRTLVTAAEDNGRTLVCVTLNAPDDWNDHISLYKKFLE